MNKTFSSFLLENSIYKDKSERLSILSDKNRVAKIFLTSFIGTLAIFGANPKGTAITKYLSNEKFVRLNAISDDNNDLTIAIKLAMDARLIKRSSAENMTKLAYLLRVKRIDSLDEQSLRTLITESDRIQLNLTGRWRSEYMDYVSGKTNIYEMMVKLREVINQSDDIGSEFKALYSRNRIFLAKKANVKADIDVEIETEVGSQEKPKEIDVPEPMPTPAIVDTPPVHSELDLTIQSNINRHFIEAMNSGNGKAYLKSIGSGVSKFPWENLEINKETASAWFLNDQAGIPNVYIGRVPLANEDKTAASNFFKKVHYIGMVNSFDRFESLPKYLDKVNSFIAKNYADKIKPKFDFEFLLNDEIINHFVGRSNKTDVAIELINFNNGVDPKLEESKILNETLGSEWFSQIADDFSSLDGSNMVMAYMLAITISMNGQSQNINRQMLEVAVNKYATLSDVSLMDKNFAKLYDMIESNNWFDNDILKKFQFSSIQKESDIYEKYSTVIKIPSQDDAIEFMDHVIAYNKFGDLIQKNSELRNFLFDELGGRRRLQNIPVDEWADNYSIKSRFAKRKFMEFASMTTIALYQYKLIENKDILLIDPKMGELCEFFGRVSLDVKSHNAIARLYKSALEHIGLDLPKLRFNHDLTTKISRFRNIIPQISSGIVYENPTVDEITNYFSQENDHTLDIHGMIGPNPDEYEFKKKLTLFSLITGMNFFGDTETVTHVMDSIVGSYSLSDIMEIEWNRASGAFSKFLELATTFCSDSMNERIKLMAEQFTLVYSSVSEWGYISSSGSPESVAAAAMIKGGDSLLSILEKLSGESVDGRGHIIQGVAKILIETNREKLEENILEVFKKGTLDDIALIFSGAAMYQPALREVVKSISKGFFENHEDNVRIEEVKNRVSELYSRRLQSVLHPDFVMEILESIGDEDIKGRIANSLDTYLRDEKSFKQITKFYGQRGINFSGVLISLDKDTAISVAERMSGVSQRKIVETLIQREFLEKTNIRESLYSPDSPIRPEMELDDTRLNQILDYNFINMSPTLPRKKKGVSLAERVSQAVDQIGTDLNKMKIKEIEMSQEELDRMSIEYLKYNSGNHGDCALRFLRTFDVDPSWTDPEFAKFKEKHPQTAHYPMFHGTGSVAASMILRYGFVVVDAGDKSTVGRMLGNGIYGSNVLDKVAQYITDAGYARKKGVVGYIFENEFVLGKEDVNYKSAGLGFDRIRSAEWCVRDPKAQISIKKVHEGMLVSNREIDRLKNSIIGENFATPLKSFTEWRDSINEEMMTEAKKDSTQMKYATTIIFRDGQLPLLDGTTINWSDFESPNQYVFIDSGRFGVALVVTYDDPELFEDDVYMVDDTKEWMNSGDEAASSLYKIMKKKNPKS